MAGTASNVKLTVRTVRAVTAAERETVIWDSELSGFGLRVKPTGRKTFVVQYRNNQGKSRRLTIGAFGRLTVDEARKEARAKLAEAELGGDPTADRKQARQTASNSSTFEVVVDEFIEKYARKRQRTWKETKRVLVSGCAKWRERPIADITKRDAYELLDDFVADGHEAKARVTLSWLRKLWRWAWQRDMVAAPIMDAVKLELERKVRDRFYADDEIRAIWQGADRMAPAEGGFVKLALLLAVRKRELSGMRRSELDDPENPTLWTIPFERTKSRKSTRPERQRAYLVPLPPLARRILKAMPKKDDELFFPGRRKGQPFDPGSWLTRRVRDSSGVEDFYFHACRDTVATWLQDQGYSEFERGLVLNHAGGGSVTADYSHGYPVELKRRLLEEWAEHVAACVGPEGAIILS